MATFATRLTQLRQERKMSQQELAHELKISRSAVGMYEQGRRGPDFAILDNVAELFDVDFNYMLGKTDIRGKYPKAGIPVIFKDKNGIRSIPTIVNQKELEKMLEYQKQLERDQVLQAYDGASPEIQAAVRRVLGMDQ